MKPRTSITDLAGIMSQEAAGEVAAAIELNRRERRIKRRETLGLDPE